MDGHTLDTVSTYSDSHGYEDGSQGSGPLGHLALGHVLPHLLIAVGNFGRLWSSFASSLEQHLLAILKLIRFTSGLAQQSSWLRCLWDVRFEVMTSITPPLFYFYLSSEKLIRNQSFSINSLNNIHCQFSCSIITDKKSLT